MIYPPPCGCCGARLRYYSESYDGLCWRCAVVSAVLMALSVAAPFLLLYWVA